MASPGAWMAGATIFSAIFQIEGARQQNEMQAELARKQKEYLEEQKHLIGKARDRDLDIFEREVSALVGQQQAAFGKAGVELTDSAVRVTSNTIARAEEEKIAIEEQAAANIRLADYKIEVAQKKQDFYRDIGTWQTLGAVTGAVGNLAYYSYMGRNNPNFWGTGRVSSAPDLKSIYLDY